MKDDRVRLLHMKEALERVITYCADGKKTFLDDIKTQDAVIRNLEIVGEAVKHLSPKLKRTHKDVPWKQIAGMRDRLIHHYFGVSIIDQDPFTLHPLHGARFRDLGERFQILLAEPTKV